ncbi:hypothetical protein [Bifidobacterium porcinum]|uniref:hypothetical protein n=1 Tax=Bifidobacterium porcinum TaxID=212365 RepID=UPI003995EF20
MDFSQSAPSTGHTGSRHRMLEVRKPMDAKKHESEMLERARRDMADPNTFPGSIPYDDQEIEDDANWGIWWIKDKNGDSSDEWPFDKETGQIVPPVAYAGSVNMCDRTRTLEGMICQCCQCEH